MGNGPVWSEYTRPVSMNFTKTLSVLGSDDADSFMVKSCGTDPIGELLFSISIG